MSEYLTITQAAKLKGCTRVTIYKWLKQGKLNTHEVAGKRFVVNDAKLAQAQSQMKEDMSRVESLEKRVEGLEGKLQAVEAENAKLAKQLEEILAKSAEPEKHRAKPREAEPAEAKEEIAKEIRAGKKNINTTGRYKGETKNR